MSLNIKIDADISGVDQAVNNVSKSLNSLKAPTVNAGNALNSLSQVTRDLPFGFVAIQNNLPLVVDSFGQLTKQAGGVGGALKSLGASLVGPAGLSFAFGAVIAGVTALIQKYGSLGEAANQILGLTPKVTEAQKAYNKAIFETSGNLTVEQEKINILVKTITNLDKPQKDRLAAYEALKKIAPDVVAGIRDENALSNESISIINNQAAARKELLKLKIQEAGINAALTTNATKLAELNAKLVKADQEYVQASKDLNKTNKDNIVTGFGSQTQTEKNTKAFSDAVGAVTQLRNQISALEKENQIFIDQLDPAINKIAQLNKGTNDRVNGLKNEIKAESDLTAQRKKSLDQAIKDQEEFEASVLKGQQAAVKFRIELEKNQSIQNRAAEIKRLAEEYKKLETATFQQADIDMEQDAQAFNPLKNLGEKLISVEQEADLKTRAQQVNDVLNNTLFTPLSGLFEGLATEGVSSFKEFGKQVLQVIKRLAAQIIASGLIKLLGSLLLPGGGGLGIKAAGGIGGFLKGVVGGVLGIGKVAAPSFGGVQGGSLSMGGQVNVVLRGSDLVGSINRTNSNISRVG